MSEGDLARIRAEHGLTETPADLFRQTPPEERRKRYALPMGSTAQAWPGERRPEETPEARREVPAPEYTSRDPWPDGVEAPLAARSFTAGAQTVGWDVRCTYARGYALPHKRDGAPYPVATVAARFSRDLGNGRARGGYVVWHCRLDRKAKWEAKGCMVFGSDHWPVVVGLTVTEVGRYLVEWESLDVERWRVTLKAKDAATKRRAAETAKARGRAPKVEVS